MKRGLRAATTGTSRPQAGRRYFPPKTFDGGKDRKGVENYGSEEWQPC
jgi:hypothetical protein